VIPTVTDRDEFWKMKQDGLPPKRYVDFHMPKNTPMGIYISIFAFFFGFGVVWHILWLVILGLVGAIGCLIVLSFDEHQEYVLTAGEVEQLEKQRANR
jgi:cytochrome o ubiquinol oxidase subunit 1